MTKRPRPTEAPQGVRVTNESVKLDALTFDPDNAAEHTDAQIQKIEGSIREFGYVNLLAVQPSLQVIGGEATLKALRSIHEAEPGTPIDVRMVHGLTALQYKKLGLALNKLGDGRTYNSDRLADILREVQDAGDDPTDLGFDDKEVDRLLGEGGDPLEVKEIATSHVDDEFWISIRGPLEHQADALAELEALMKKYSGITVELGTIAMG